MDPEKERYYEVLGLKPTASPEDVYRAYRDLARIWDPQRFVTQPRLELMAEAKLKEIIEAYNALTGKTDVSATPAPPEPPEILSPVPEHIIDKNAPLPVFLPEAFVPAEPGQPIEEPPETARPLSDWEKEQIGRASCRERVYDDV